MWYVGPSDGTSFASVGEVLNNTEGSATFSPDGASLVAGGEDAAGKPGLFQIPIDGSAPKRLISPKGLDPVWSEQANLIVYTSATIRFNFRRLLAIRPDGSPVKIPAIEVNSPQAGRFLPDGTGFIYRVWSEFWYLDLTAPDLATQKPRRLTQFTSPALIGSFDITPDGKQIVFDRLRRNSDIYLIDLPAKR